MYFPQLFPGKVRDLDWQSSFPLLTPPLSRASRALKKKKKKDRERTTANKTTVWTVYSTTEIMEIPRNDGHEGLLKRIAVVHSTRFTLIVSVHATPSRRVLSTELLFCLSSRHLVVPSPSSFPPRLEHYFLTSCYFKTIMSDDTRPVQ